MRDRLGAHGSAMAVTCFVRDGHRKPQAKNKQVRDSGHRSRSHAHAGCCGPSETSAWRSQQAQSHDKIYGRRHTQALAFLIGVRVALDLHRCALDVVLHLAATALLDPGALLQLLCVPGDGGVRHGEETRSDELAAGLLQPAQARRTLSRMLSTRRNPDARLRRSRVMNIERVSCTSHDGFWKRSAWMF